MKLLKDLLTKAPVLAYYDPNKPATLSVDASQSGLGATLLQNKQPVAYASCALTSCEERYAQIEKEALAIAYGCDRFRQFIYGQEILVETDHKPLEAICSKNLSKAPPRLQTVAEITEVSAKGQVQTRQRVVFSQYTVPGN